MKACAQDPQGKYYEVINVDTGEVIPYCVWADDQTGEYCQLARDENGEFVLEWANPAYRHLPIERWLSDENKKYGGLQAKRITKKGRIKLNDTRKAPLVPFDFCFSSHGKPEL